MSRRQPTSHLTFTDYLISFLAGSFILCLFATSQKFLVGAPLIAKGYIAPLIYGGTVAVILRRWITRAKTSESLRTLSERRYGQLFDQSNELIIALTGDGNIRYTNPACQTALGFTDTELTELNIEKLIEQNLLPQWKIDVNRLHLQGYLPPLRTTLIGKHAQKIYLEGNLYFEHPDSQSLDFRAVFQDVSLRKQAQAALVSSEKKLSTIFHNSSAAVVTVDQSAKFIKVNDAFCRMLGYTEDEIYTKNWQDLCHPEDWPKLEHLRDRALNSHDNSFEIELRLNHRVDRPVWGLLSSSWVSDCDGTPEYTVAIIQDISDGKLAKERIKKLSLYDPLTGLPNRSRLRRIIEKAFINKSCIGLLSLDLDKFKVINDSLGPTAGDRLLQKIAERLRSIESAKGLLARTGGDEFALLISDLDSPAILSEIARKILESLATPFTFAGKQIYTTASIGIVFSCDKNTNAESLLMHADSAMYAAKEQGGNRFQFFSAEMNQRMLERLQLEDQLRRAISKQQLELYYQPQIQLDSLTVCGVEALIRWNHPDFGLLEPAHFISIAEECGMISQIDTWVMEEACRQSVLWQQQGLPAMTMSVNISSLQFRQPELCQQVEKILQQTGLTPSNLKIELTESSVMDDIVQAEQTMQQLRQLGVSLAIDDFGTGYSSLSYLKHFPITHLKIDRSFICDLTENLEDQSITNAIIALAHSLELRVIAEGVETTEQLNYLKQNSCHEIQGFIFSPALPVTECQSFVQAFHNKLAKAQ